MSFTTNLKAVITRIAAEIKSKIPMSQKGAANGVAALDSEGKIAFSQLPEWVASYPTYSAFPAVGDGSKLYLAEDTQVVYGWTGTSYIVMGSSVYSVNGRMGSVVLYKSDVGLTSVDNTSDLQKPISTATQTALNAKQGLDPTLTALAGLTNSANTLPYFTATDVMATTPITSFARTLLADVNAAEARAALELGTAATAAASAFQPVDTDLTAIAELSATSGLLKKTAADTWMLDNTAYLTGNEVITVTGDATGSGNTSIALTLAASGVTAGTYGTSIAVPTITVDAKGRITTAVATTIRTGTTSQTGVVQLNSTVTSTSTTTAATPSAVKTAYDLAFAAIPAAQKGAISGVATLDATGKVPAAQLPSYVDDVLEFADLASLPATGESNKIYVTIDSSKIYRWSGSAYIEINASSGSTDTALRWAVARNVAITGDASWTVSLDGSADVSGVLTLANSGVTAGTYGKVTVDAKGRVTVGSALVEADLPSLSAAKITSGTFPVSRGGTGATTLTGILKGNGTGAFTAAVAGTDYPTVASVTAKLDKNTDIVAGTGTKITYDVKGLVLSSTTLAASDIPNLDWAKITTGKPTTRAGYGITDVPTVTGTGASGAWAITVTGLTTARTINGVSFDGTANIVVEDSTKIPTSQKGVASGVASLDNNGKLPVTQLPSFIEEYPNFASFPVTGEGEKLYLANDTQVVYGWSGTNYIVMGSSVYSVNGKTGTVTLVKADVGLGSVDNTSDLNKPISTATQAQLTRLKTLALAGI